MENNKTEIPVYNSSNTEDKILATGVTIGCLGVVFFVLWVGYRVVLHVL